MLSFDLRSLEAKAAQVDGSVQPDDPVWEEGDNRPSEPIRVTGRLSAAGDGRFYFTGRMEGRFELPCRRCLEPVNVEVSEDVHFLLAELGAEERRPRISFRSEREVASIPARRRETWRYGPADSLHRLQRLARCGTNLNESTCNCTPTSTDSRWGALLRHHGDAH